MADNAGIQLQVGLDLAYFRNQLPSLGTTAAGYRLPINIKFDRLSVQKELNTLGTNIKKRNYFLEVKTNLASEIKNAKDLASALDNLARSSTAAKASVTQRLGVGAIGRAPLQGGLGSKDVEKLYRASARAGLLAFDKEIVKGKASMVAAMEAVGIDSIAGLLNGLSSQDARLRAAAEYLGETLIKTAKTSLGIASPSKEFEKIGKNVGEGFEKGALSSMDNAFDALENKMRQRGKILDTVARGIFRMLGMDPAAMLQQARQQRLPAAINWQAIAPRRTPSIGPSSTGRLLEAAPSRNAIAGVTGPAGLLPSITQQSVLRRDLQAFMDAASARPSVAQGPGKLALSNEALGQRISTILQEYFKVAEIKVRETFDPRELQQGLNFFSYIAQSLRDAESRTKQARVAKSVDSLMQAIDNAIKVAQVKVRISRVQAFDLGATQRLALPPAYRGIGPTAAPIGLLPAGAGMSTRDARIQQAYARSAARSASIINDNQFLLPSSAESARRRPAPYRTQEGMTGASSQLGAGYYAVGQSLQSMKQAYAGVKPFLDTKKLPLSGAMAELGAEFGNAIKQVLLYGTAYKALAFFTSLPGQAFEAAKGLATYRNQLQAVTAESKTFDQSLAFVDNLAQRFNVPLESARQGFVKLYASMQPAGFGQGQIENLFTGISKAAAAFGLSADKVDRVNYAFAQMASKGQIMSEELKGQLGDVLPGALGLFAQAAQMSIPEFSKAMEDGAFKGKAMAQVLDNVAILMNSKFGPAAQGASKTLQGAVNQIQNNLKLMYESFTPVVNAFALAFGPQVNSLIKDVTSTMQVLTGTFVKTGEGFSALSPRAQFFYESVKALEPAVRQAGAAILDLGSRFAALLPAIVNAVSAAITFASSPLGRGALIATAAIATLSGALKLLEVTGIKAAIKAVYTFIGSLLQMPAATGVARAAIISLKLAFTGLIVGGVLIGLDLLIGKLLNIGDAADRARKDVKELAFNLNDLASAGDMIGLGKKRVESENQVIIAERLLQTYQKLEKGIKLSAQERQFLKEFGTRNPLEGGVAYAEKELSAALEKRGMAQKALNAAEAAQQRDKIQREKELQKVDLFSGDKDTKKGQDKLANQQQQSAIDAANRQNALNKAITEGLMALDDQAFQHRLDLIDARNNYELAGLNSIEARQEKFQQDLQKIELQRIDTVRKAQQQASKASMEYAAAQNTAAAAQPGAPVTGQIDKSILRNWLISQGFGRTTGDFTNKGHATPNHILNAMDMGILGGSDAEALRKTAAMERKLRATGAFGSQLFGPISDPYGHGAGKGGQNIHLHIPTPGGKVKMTAGLASLMGQGGATNVTQRREAKAGGKLAVEAQQVSSQQEQAQREFILATNKALSERASLIKSNINTLFPVAEQRLENDLMKIRNQLQMQGMPQEYIDYQEKVYKGAYEAAEFIKRQKETTDEYTASRDALLKKQKEGVDLTPREIEDLRFYNDAIEQNNKSIKDLTESQKQYRIATLENTIASLKNADALKAQQDTISLINSSVESASSSYKGFLKEVIRGGDPSEALKKFQDALTDQVLTIFLDFAMKPVEDFFKEQLSAMFGVETEKSAREKTIAKLEEQLAEAKRIAVATEQTAVNTTPGANGTSLAVTGFSDESINTGFGNASGANFENLKLSAENALSSVDFEKAFEPAQKNIQAALERLSLSMDANAYSLSQSAVDYSANFENVGDSAKKMAEDAGKAAEEADKNGEDFKESLGKVAAGIGIAASTIMGIAAGISQIKEGGTGNVLMGIGSILASVGGGIGGFAKLFAADGGVAAGGWKPLPLTAFANGGMVNGPTLGLIGEGRYNEAIVPLPNGRSIPVEFNQQSSLKDAMRSSSTTSSVSPILSMTFESTNINGVEYVSRDQLEQAMAETRRRASRDGAQRGMTMTLDKLQQSPSTRRRVGI